MRKIIIASVFTTGMLFIIASSCKKKDATPTNCSTTLSFAKDIQPIINTNCAISGCHNGTTKPNLTQYSGVQAAASDIKSQVSSGSMPQGRTLTSTDKDALLCWIANGAANN
jgi:hypothetical protein